MSSTFADGASGLAAFEAQSRVSEDAGGWNKATTWWIGAVGSVGSFKLNGLVGEGSEQIGTDDGANRG
jgi:hypothetical protein